MRTKRFVCAGFDRVVKRPSGRTGKCPAVPDSTELWAKKGLIMRAYKFVDEITGADENGINIPIIGGHAGATFLPLFSQDATAATIAQDKIPDLDKKVQDAGTDVCGAYFAP